jgi:hypothetical protein
MTNIYSRKTRTYRIFKGMKSRCYSPSFNNEQNKYQSLGIIVDERWKHSYENFIDDMGVCPEGYSIERIEVLGNYCKENCKWIPMNEQSKNRTNTPLYTIGDESKILKDWAREFGINYTTLWHRVHKKGMTIKDAITYTPYIEMEGITGTVKFLCIVYGVSYDAVMTKKSRNKELEYVDIIKSYID